jgi:light-regulated signal transduction histidine kinase (bacteriophytochrome)
VLASVIDISIRKQAEQDFRRSADELARSNAELEQFAYVASHDLREPLRMVQSFCGLLKDRYSDKLDEQANTYINFAVDGATRMQWLVDDLLEFARIGRSNERLESVSLDDVLRQALTNLEAAIVESGATIEFDRLPTIRGDAIRLTQVFQNLIGNAIKFRGASPPAIQVTACREGDAWRITVADNGIGIDPKHFHRLFVVFQRLHTKEEYPGTGIGLALCKRIVELHGGRIWLESQPGRGTSFHFRLLPADESSFNSGQEGEECNLVMTTT